MKLRYLLNLVVLASMILIVLSCKNRLVLNEVIIGRFHSPGILSPFAAEDSASTIYLQWLFPSLTGKAYTSDTVWSILADTVPFILLDNEKNLWTTRVNFRPSAKWDDGTPVDFSDVIFSLKLSANTFYDHFYQEPELKEIVSIESTDGRNFRVYSKSRSGIESLLNLPILPAAADSNSLLARISLSGILNDSLTENQKKDLLSVLENTKHLAAGSGAYFISEQSDTQLVLIRKEHWWGNPFNSWNIYFALYPVSITYRFFQNHKQALAELRNGKLDVLDELTAEERAALLVETKIAQQYHFYSSHSQNIFTAIHRKFSNAPPYPKAPGYWEGGFAVTFQTK